MSRGKVVVIVVVSSCVAAAAIGAGAGWFARSPVTDSRGAGEPQREADVRRATRAVELLARAAAEPPAADVNSPAKTDATAAEAEPPQADTPPPPPPQPPPPRKASKPSEVRWVVNAHSADATSNDGALCGGKVCAADQFCCGPPECGRCANRLTGPRCPASCQ